MSVFVRGRAVHGHTESSEFLFDLNCFFEYPKAAVFVTCDSYELQFRVDLRLKASEQASNKLWQLFGGLTLFVLDRPLRLSAFLCATSFVVITPSSGEIV